MTPRNRILITGCSSGIGLDAARTLHAQGWTVYATCRREADCARLRAEGLDSFPLDYADPESIAAAVETVQARGGLDALYNNGAFAIPGRLEDMPRDALRDIFETNLFGYHDLTTRVIPLMRAQGHGRIINCSSVLGIVGVKWRGPYVSTKFALEGLTDVLRMELAESPIDVILLQPGPIRTEIRRKAQVGFEKWVNWQDSIWADHYRDTLLPRLYADNPPPDTFELPASAVTKALLRALTDARPKTRYRITWPTFFAAAFRRLLPHKWIDRLTANA